MGSCYSKYNILHNNNQNNNSNNECLICFEYVNLTNNYVKCKKCKILLHVTCAVKYKYIQNCRNVNCNKLKCPHCQHCKTSYLYTYDDIYNI